MLKRPREEAREQRIQWEIVPDAHDAEEQAAGWYAYLEDTLRFPFLTRCRAERASSPLRLNDEVEVMGVAPDEHDVFVEVRWAGHTLQEAHRLIGCVVTTQISQVLQQQRPYDEAAYIAALRRLPTLPWEDEDANG